MRLIAVSSRPTALVKSVALIFGRPPAARPPMRIVLNAGLRSCIPQRRPLSRRSVVESVGESLGLSVDSVPTRSWQLHPSRDSAHRTE
jgi:hypothetical protein